MNIHAILSGQDRSPRAQCLRAAAAVGEPVYRAAIAARNAMFDAALRKPHDLGRPTVSVGNVTTGGTGKTPMVVDLTRRLMSRGQNPAILMRGYGPGKESDEAIEFADRLGPKLYLGVDPDRNAVARRLLAKHPDITHFILDDGFQRRQSKRDLDIVLVDATCPFGFDRLLPRGLLREPAANLRRADAVIVTRADQAETADLDRRIEQLHGKPPIAHAMHAWTGYTDANDNELPLDALRDKRVAVVCGIGNPDAFHACAQKHMPGASADVIAFADHHLYQQDELTSLMRSLDADAVLTTDKDWVKWRAFELPLPVYRPNLQMQYRDGEAAVDALLDTL